MALEAYARVEVDRQLDNLLTLFMLLQVRVEEHSNFFHFLKCFLFYNVLKIWPFENYGMRRTP